MAYKRESIHARSPATVRRPVEPWGALPSRANGACSEILEAVQDAAVWTALAHRDIKARYRRTALGPVWIVILVMVSAGMIATVYGVLFGQPFARYFVFVAASLVSWTLIANVVSEAASLFWLSGTLMKTFQISPVAFLLANMWKNLIVWCHAILPALIGVAFVRVGDFRAVAMLPIGLFLVVLNLGWIAFVIALLGARFRDVHDLVLTLMAIAFLVTPVIWDASMLGDYRGLADFNPLAHLLDLVRRPVLGQWPNLASFIFAGFAAVVGWPMACIIFAAVRTRLPLWVG